LLVHSCQNALWLGSYCWPCSGLITLNAEPTPPGVAFIHDPEGSVFRPDVILLTSSFPNRVSPQSAGILHNTMHNKSSMHFLLLFTCGVSLEALLCFYTASHQSSYIPVSFDIHCDVIESQLFTYWAHALPSCA
jgi:hypothetical protein